ncbi:unnamed protein product [Durusdinium trenchii]|uniref:mRNA cap 0 methyltransferase domain-containing protein n=1 Tax=Durusdinium trenchii TaxID=1381693 RepID=A0ABP0NED4_9DINO
MAAELNGRAKRTLSDAGLLRQLTEMRIKHYLYVGAKHRALVGLYFGTFDPLHENHFRLVLCALRTCGLRRVVLVPNQGSNPYKQGCTPMSERVACIKERIRIAEEAGELEPGEVIVRKEAGANNWPQREKVAQAVEREEFADATVTANVVLLLGEDSFSKSLSQATGKHKNVGIFQLQSRPRRLIVFPRAQQELVIPEKLRDYVQVAPYKDLVEGLSSSKIRALVETGAEAPDAQAVHPAVWARLKEYVKSAASEGSADALGTRSSGEDEEESFVPHSDQGNCWADPAAHYDAQAPSSSSLRDRPQSPTVRLRNFNSFAKAVLLDQFLTDVLRQAGGEGRPLSVLDLGCGKGGDLKKLMNSGLTHYCGLDVSYASLEVFRARLKDLQSNRAPRHGLLGRSEGLALKEVALIHADAFRECLESTWDRRRYGTARSQLGRSWFHLVTSQMACHYAFQSQESLETMLDNVSKRLCSGGYFVATVPDAKRIVSAQRNALSLGRAFGRLGNNLFGIEFSEEEWSKVESITWDETSDQLDKRAFGIMYRFDLVDAVDSCLEPLVHFPSLRAIAKSKGLQLSLAPTPLSQLVMGDKAELGRLRRIYAFAGGMALHSNEAREQREAMEFYVAFAFQKEQAEDLPTCQEVSEGVRAQKRGQDFIDMLHLLHLMHRPPSGRSRVFHGNTAIMHKYRCAIAMAVFSKMSGRRTAVPLVLGAAALAATSFVVPGAPVQQVSARTPVTAQVKQDAASSLPGLTAGVTMGVTAAAAAANRRKPVRSQKSLAKAKKEMSESGLLHLVASVQDVLSKPHEGDRIRDLKALAAELKHTQNSTSPMEGPLRWVANMAAALLLTQGMALQPANAGDVVNYSDFIDSVNKGDVEMVRVQPDMLSAQYVTKEGARREVNLIPNGQIEDQLFNQLADKKVDVVMSTGEAGSPFDFLARFAGPLAWLVAGLLLLFGGVGGPAGPGGPGGNPFELGKSKARIIKDGDTKVKFGDVAGCDGAKTELVEVVDFLKNASRYSELGAKIPKGALLVGPPGTGKTLLAKAVAGEAGVPFFSISASEFVEVFAGVGASRVRDLFEQAKKSAPCIIFIDEIDAVGRQRSAGFGQGNDEREQTVNQLLTEMDGFESNKGVVVLAATNRADILDQALVRPGRFDRQIQVDPPDVQGRLEILKVYAKGKNLAPGIDLSAIAKQTPGMSGADLANLLNEGAIVAARQNKSEIDSDDIFNALERIALGLEKKDAVMSEQRRRLVAYHEAGHAILGALVNDYDAVAKISIVPRGPAGGVTIFMPSEERLNSGLYSKEFLENRMCVSLGGRLAEEIINGKDNVTTGASNDFQQCTQVAKQMVMQLGMSSVIGQRQLGGQQQGGPFMGRDFMGQGAPPMSQALKQQVDDEVKRIVDEQYQRGMKLLRDNMFLLDELAKLLMEQEKVSGEELVKLINRAAIDGKLAVDNKQMAFAAFTGEKVDDNSMGSKLTSKCLPSMTSMTPTSMPKGFCGSTLRPRHDRAAARNAIARLGLAHDEKAVSSEKVLQEVQRMATDVSNGSALPSQVVRTAAVQTLVSLAAMAGPSAAVADDVAVPQSVPQPMTQMQATGRVTYSRFLEFVEDGAVKRVDMYDMGRTAVASVTIAGREQQLICDLPGASTGVIDKLVAKNVAIDVHQPDKPNPLFGALADAAFPLLTIAGLLFLRSQNPGTGGIPGLGNQGKAQIMISPDTGVKFENVAGIDEAKEELTEIVDFLKAPERFVKVGAKIPRGVLLTGPPGTGKTLMAKALAGEAGVPFIQSSASEFIELFVGVGASRVRDIFKQAKEKAPCIVFIDEIDAIGRQRGAGMGGGDDEREQTLNQILTETARIAGALGGRVAEQLVFGSSQVTTGAGGDLQQVERMARAMVTQFGMSDQLCKSCQDLPTSIFRALRRTGRKRRSSTAAEGDSSRLLDGGCKRR